MNNFLMVISGDYKDFGYFCNSNMWHLGTILIHIKLMVKIYNRIMLSKAGFLAKICKDEGFMVVDFLNEIDLTNHLHEDWHDFNKEYIPVWLKSHPEKTNVAAELACGNLCKGLQVDDIVLSSNGIGAYYVGKIIGKYSYKLGEPLLHRRKVEWFPISIQRTEMSEQLHCLTGS